MLDLHIKIRDCTKCGLCKLMPFKPVPGIGPIDADIFIVGEAPGKDESLVEEPFMGLCGKFLTKCLNEVGIDRKKCYITNVVKCRPTEDNKKNRPPHKSEINACYPWLHQELDIVKPKVILGLGKTALQFLFNTKTGIKGNVGEIHRLDGSKVICTYHPSYILQYGKKKQDEFILHLKKVKVLVDGI